MIRIALFVLLAALAGPVLAQGSGDDGGTSDTQPVKGNKPRAAPKVVIKDEPRTAPKAAPKAEPAFACYQVTVVVDGEKPSGLGWDPVGPPDPFIQDTASGNSASCKDSYQCSFRTQSKGGKLQLFMEDRDLRYHDPIGSGSCAPGKSCRIGAARVSSQPC